MGPEAPLPLGTGKRWHHIRRVMYTSLNALSQQWEPSKPCIPTAQQMCSWAFTSILCFMWSVTEVKGFFGKRHYADKLSKQPSVRLKAFLVGMCLSGPVPMAVYWEGEVSFHRKNKFKAQNWVHKPMQSRSKLLWARISQSLLTFWFIGILLSWISLAEVRSGFIGI